jgi:hypothetical protein
MLSLRQTCFRSRLQSGSRLAPSTGAQIATVNYDAVGMVGRLVEIDLTFRAAGDAPYFSLIGGAIFSGGAGGNGAFAPCFSASGSGRAGSGAGVVGRVPPGFDSAGLLWSVGGAPC